MKRTLCSALACLMLLPTSALAVQATPNHQPIVRNGQKVSLAGYEIDGYTYFKLRDVATILNGTESQFSVDYDGTGISLTTGQPYTRVQGDLAPIPDGTVAETALISLPLTVNGQSVTLTACEVGGFNYLKLRDLGEALNFPVDYDESTHTILLGAHAMPAEAVLELVNKARAAQGVDALTLDPDLCKAAAIRAEELGTYFSHDRPDGTSCFTVFDEVGIKSYHAAGENIAMGYTDAVMVMEGWMNSPGHRANILSEDYSRIGIARSGSAWVQLFLD